MIKKGDEVKIKDEYYEQSKRPSCGWGSMIRRQGQKGTVTRVSGNRLTIDFPSHRGWSGKVKEVEPVNSYVKHKTKLLV